MRRKLLQAKSLTTQEWGVFVYAWLLLLWVELALRYFSFARVSQWLTSKPTHRNKAQPSGQANTIQRTCQLVDIASRNHILAITCLRRSLVTQKLLAQQGIPVELRFGVNRQAGAFRAHAWLEYQGQTIGEAEPLSQAYEPLAR